MLGELMSREMKSVAPSRHREGVCRVTVIPQPRGLRTQFPLRCQSRHSRWVQARLLAIWGTSSQWAWHSHLASGGGVPYQAEEQAEEATPSKKD